MRMRASKVVSAGSLSNWLSDIDKAEREERKRKIQEMWLACYTAEEIAEVVGLKATQVQDEIRLSTESSDLKLPLKVTFSEEDFTPPLYNVWHSLRRRMRCHTSAK